MYILVRHRMTLAWRHPRVPRTSKHKTILLQAEHFSSIRSSGLQQASIEYDANLKSILQETLPPQETTGTTITVSFVQDQQIKEHHEPKGRWNLPAATRASSFGKTVQSRNWRSETITHWALGSFRKKLITMQNRLIQKVAERDSKEVRHLTCSKEEVAH